MTMSFNDLNKIEGLQFIPVNEKKQPLVKNWQTEKKAHDLSNCYGVGLVCGKVSGGVEVIDADEKYSLDGKLFENYKKEIHRQNPSLLKKLVIAKTVNNGYHVIYRCEKIEGNLKLANRETTAEEKETTYKKSYEAASVAGKSDLDAKSFAKKSSDNDKVRVLLESRGLGGMIVCSPTKGYDFIFGDLQSISLITPIERDLLFTVARQFNEYHEDVAAHMPKDTLKTQGLSPFDDFDSRGDVIALLEKNGWKTVKDKGQKTLFLRPGQSTAESSGNYDHSKKWFSVFTTSTEFEPQKAYKPSAVFAILECNKNFSEAARKLLDLGFGERAEVKKEEKPKAPSSRAIPSRINLDDGDISFLATGVDYDDYLQSVIDGTMKMGLTTGSPSLDKNFLFKEGNLVMVNGHDNTGKSVFVWWLLLIAAMYHGWKGVIFSSENTLGSFMRKMIQFYWGKPLVGVNKMTNSEYSIAKKFIESHFFLIKAQEDLYNYKDILNMVKKSRKLIPDLKYGMIDPYNSLKIDLTGFSKLSTHEYHYEALSEIKSYGQQTGFGWFVNHHAVTAALRAKDGEKKYPVAPQKADTEGGGKVANKADDFATIHRITQHPTDWMVTEFHVRKIKETDTGGQVTPFDSPVKFEMYKNGTAFIERLEEGGMPIDPIQKWHNDNKPKQKELYKSTAVIKNWDNSTVIDNITDIDF